MKNDASRRVGELRAALDAQDAEWSRAKEQLAALGDVTLGVPHEALEAIDRACVGIADREAPATFAVRG